MTLHTTTTQTQCLQYLSCSLPDFNQTLKLEGGINNNHTNNNNMNNNNNNKNHKGKISSITDPILTKLLVEGFWDKTKKNIIIVINHNNNKNNYNNNATRTTTNIYQLLLAQILLHFR